jgi:flagellar motor switch protein FliN/FliY
MSADVASILRIEVPVIVRVASRRMKLAEIRRIAPGSIIEMPRSVDEDLELLVANKPLGVGRAVKIGDSFGLRVTAIGDVRQRITALGRSEPPPADDRVSPRAEPAA